MVALLFAGACGGEGGSIEILPTATAPPAPAATVTPPPTPTEPPRVLAEAPPPAGLRPLEELVDAVSSQGLEVSFVGRRVDPREGGGLTLTYRLLVHNGGQATFDSLAVTLEHDPQALQFKELRQVLPAEGGVPVLCSGSRPVEGCSVSGSVGVVQFASLAGFSFAPGDPLAFEPGESVVLDVAFGVAAEVGRAGVLAQASVATAAEGVLATAGPVGQPVAVLEEAPLSVSAAMPEDARQTPETITLRLTIENESGRRLFHVVADLEVVEPQGWRYVAATVIGAATAPIPGLPLWIRLPELELVRTDERFDAGDKLIIEVTLARTGQSPLNQVSLTAVARGQDENGVVYLSNIGAFVLSGELPE